MRLTTRSDVSSRKLNKTGEIKEKRVGDYGQDTSFVITMGNGRETIRHRSHIRHNITRYTKVTDKKVSFNLDNTRGGEDRNVKETETKKRGRPRKEDKAESNKDYETATDSNNDFNIGIAKRTHSKTSTDLSDIPLKSCLKTRTQES